MKNQLGDTIIAFSHVIYTLKWAYFVKGISTRSCTIQVHGSTEQNLEIQATEDGQYGVLKETTHDVILRTEPLEYSIWSNCILPTVKVNHPYSVLE